MPLKDWFAALIVIAAWGINFVVIKVALFEIPPLLLGAVRFTLVAFPAIFFIKRPAISLRSLLEYALIISFAQFIFLFTAIYIGMPAGLASLVLQSQAFFTVLIAAWFLHEGVRGHNVVGIAVAVLGLVLIGWGARPGSVSVLGFTFTICAAICWAIGNIVMKGLGDIDMLALVVWGALIPPIPFFILSWLIEGPELEPADPGHWPGVIGLAARRAHGADPMDRWRHRYGGAGCEYIWTTAAPSRVAPLTARRR